MQLESTNHKPVDLAAYRKKRAEQEKPAAPKHPLDAEETITEIAHYVLMIVQAIRRPRY